MLFFKIKDKNDTVQIRHTYLIQVSLHYSCVFGVVVVSMEMCEKLFIHKHYIREVQGERLLLWKCIPESLHLYCCHFDKSIYTCKERSIPSSCWRGLLSQESSLDSAERNLLSGRHVQCPRDFPHSVFGSSCECLYFDCMFLKKRKVIMNYFY